VANKILSLIQSHSELQQFDELALRILEMTGIEAREEPLLAEMADAGFDVDRSDSRIRFAPELVDSFLVEVPRSFTLGGREHEDDLLLDGSSFYVRPQSGCPNVVDIETGAHRPAVLEDVKKLAVLGDALPHIHLAASLLYPSDVPGRSRDLAALAAIFENTRKHVYIQPYDPIGMERMVEMALCLRGSREAVRERPPFTAIMGLTSPLVFAPNEIGAMRVAARNAIPLMCGSTPMNGATGPVTLAGEIVLHHAENIAGLVIAQVMRRGSPVTYAIRPSTMDMRTGASVWGSVEWGMMTAVLLQLAAYRGLIGDAVGLSTDSKTADIQSGAEKGLNAVFSALFGAAVVAGAGFLDTIMTGSFEQLVVDNDLSGAMQRIRSGITVDDDHLAVEPIQRIGPGGNYLTEPHTLKYMKDEVFMPSVFSRDLRHRWVEKGSRTGAEAARERVLELLASHEVPPLPQEVSAELGRLARIEPSA